MWGVMGGGGGGGGGGEVVGVGEKAGLRVFKIKKKCGDRLTTDRVTYRGASLLNYIL